MSQFAPATGSLVAGGLVGEKFGGELLADLTESSATDGSPVGRATATERILIAGVELAVDVHTELLVRAVAVANGFVSVFTVGCFVLVERASLGFRWLRPLHCSIYDIALGGDERFYSSPTRSRSVRAAPSGSAPWCTTA